MLFSGARRDVGSPDRALQDRKERFDPVRVDVSVDVFGCVVNNVVSVLFLESLIPATAWGHEREIRG